MVEVDCARRGGWTVMWPGHHPAATYDTVDQALHAARANVSLAPFNDPVQLIVRDAYHRVVHRESIRGHHNAAAGRRPRGHELHPIGPRQRFPARWQGDHRKQKSSLAA
jgi:hypothetical protein